MKGTYEYFLAALRHVLSTTKLSQKKISDAINAAPQTVNAYVNGRTSAGEKRQDAIANACGYALIDFINLGKEILDSKKKGLAPEPQQEIPPAFSWKYKNELAGNRHGRPQTRQRAFYIWEELACKREMDFPGSFDSTVLHWQIQDYIDGKLTDEELFNEAVEWNKNLIRRIVEFYQERLKNKL